MLLILLTCFKRSLPKLLFFIFIFEKLSAIYTAVVVFDFVNTMIVDNKEFCEESILFENIEIPLKFVAK
jgi:hypothetical protein